MTAMQEKIRHLNYMGVDNQVWGRLYRYYRMAENAQMATRSTKPYRAEQNPTTAQQELLRPLMLEIGGLESIRGALIDDCALARRVKEAGGTTWIGLTRSARSIRAYEGLGEIWNMVARTAFTQLGYSAGMLALCTLAMALAFWAPVAAVAAGPPAARLLSAGALAGMAFLYRPTLAFYGRSWAWSLAMPLTAALFLAMTWTSAVRFWKGDRSRWKDRIYDESMTLRRGS